MVRVDRETDRPTLLLIDDCVLQRDLYEIALQTDFHIVTATRGDDGLRLAVCERPDAIVLDVVMPGLNGWDTCTRLKSNEATMDIPVILLTGSNDADLIDHARAVGASMVLKKPCPAETLRDILLGAVERSSSNPAADRRGSIRRIR